MYCLFIGYFYDVDMLKILCELSFGYVFMDVEVFLEMSYMEKFGDGVIFVGKGFVRKSYGVFYDLVFCWFYIFVKNI